MRSANSLLIPEQASPGTPASGYLAVFSKPDGLYYKRDDGAEFGPLGAAPTNVVTLDTAQTITGGKSFDGVLNVRGLDNALSLFEPTLATGTVQNVNSPIVRLHTKRWDGTASVEENITVRGVRGSAAAGDFYLNVDASLRATTLFDGGNRVYSLGNKVPVAGISATGTPDGTTYLRGDGAWVTVSAGTAANVVTTSKTTANKLTVDVGAAAPASPATGDLWVVTDAPNGDLANYVTLDSAQTITGAKTFNASPILPANSIQLSYISATGVRDATSYLRGDGTWSVPTAAAPANMVTTDTAQTIIAAKSFNAATYIQGQDNIFDLLEPQATSGTVTTYNSPLMRFYTKRWDGAASVTETITVRGTRGSATAGDFWLNVDSALRATALFDNGNRVYSAGNKVPVTGLSVTGTGSTTNYLRGDGSWQTLYTSVEAFPVSAAGTLAVKAGVFKVPVAYNCMVESIHITAGTASAGASIIADVNRNGTTMYTTQTNRPTLAAGAVIANAPLPDVMSLTAGDYLTVDVDQVGSTTAGSDLLVLIRLRRT